MSLIVLMTAYNTEEYIAEAISSILEQSYQDFYFYILDDGSTDQTAAVIQSYMIKDSRIAYLKNINNLGIIRSRNKLLDLIVCKDSYVIFIDSDDQLDSTMFEKQINYLNKNPSVGVVGTNLKFLESQQIANFSDYNGFVKEALNFTNVVPMVSMFRAQILMENNISFDQNLLSAEDYQFWIDFGNFCDFFILPEPLYFYRRHSLQESTANKMVQANEIWKISLKQLKEIYPLITIQDIECINSTIIISKDSSQKIQDIYKYILENNEIQKICSQQKLQKYIDYKLKKLFERAETIDHQTRELIEKTHQNSCSKVSVYGMGEIGRSICELASMRNITIEGMFDKRAKTEILEFNGDQVQSQEELLSITSKVVIIASYFFKEQILEELKSVLADQCDDYTFITLD